MAKTPAKKRPKIGAKTAPIKKPRRDQVLRVVVTPEDRAHIERRAGSARLSVSTFLRNVGLGVEVHSTTDLDTAMNIVRLNGDLNRLGGLLKLWLSGKRGEGAGPVQVNRVLNDIQQVVVELRSVASELGRK